MFELPVEATKLVVRTLTVNSHCLAHGIAAREAVAVPCRRYGWSVIAGGAVIVCRTRVLACDALVSAGICHATCASHGTSAPSTGDRGGSPTRADGVHPLLFIHGCPRAGKPGERQRQADCQPVALPDHACQITSKRGRGHASLLHGKATNDRHHGLQCTGQGDLWGKAHPR